VYSADWLAVEAAKFLWCGLLSSYSTSTIVVTTSFINRLSRTLISSPSYTNFQMQKIKRVFRKRRNETEPATSSSHGPVTSRATAPAGDTPHIPPLTNVGSSDTSYTWSSKGTPPNGSTGLRHIDSSSHIAAAAAARAATGYSEHVADRNIAERTATKEEGKPIEKDASALADEERTKRVYANPHSTGEYYLGVMTDLRFH
jgi:hypothetical protein